MQAAPKLLFGWLGERRSLSWRFRHCAAPKRTRYPESNISNKTVDVSRTASIWWELFYEFGSQALGGEFVLNGVYFSSIRLVDTHNSVKP